MNYLTIFLIILGKEIKIHRSNLIELLFWLVISCLLSFPVLQEFFFRGMIYLQTYEIYSSQVILSFVATLVPVIFAFVYGDFPINYLKQKNLASKRDVNHRGINGATSEKVNGFDSEIVSTDMTISTLRTTHQAIDHKSDRSSEYKVLEYIRFMVVSSTKLADRMLRNASLYLFSGVLIAIVGLGFFYTQTLSAISLGVLDFSRTMLSLAPKFGILFFIELIAFFFLKQYRTSMDEFRYYESLKRSREETYAIVRLMMLDGGKIDMLKLIEKYGFRTKVDKLEAGQSLDHLEARKLDKSEIEILAKIVDVFGKKS